MQDAAVVEPTFTEQKSPFVLAPNENGTLRFCVDYRRLTAATVRRSYSIPRMNECISSLGDAATTTTLDCISG